MGCLKSLNHIRESPPKNTSCRRPGDRSHRPRVTAVTGCQENRGYPYVYKGVSKAMCEIYISYSSDLLFNT